MHESSPRFSAWRLFVLTVVADVPPANPLISADTPLTGASTTGRFSLWCSPARSEGKLQIAR